MLKTQCPVCESYRTFIKDDFQVCNNCGEKVYINDLDPSDLQKALYIKALNESSGSLCEWCGKEIIKPDFLQNSFGKNVCTECYHDREIAAWEDMRS